VGNKHANSNTVPLFNTRSMFSELANRFTDSVFFILNCISGVIDYASGSKPHAGRCLRIPKSIVVRVHTAKNVMYLIKLAFP
jgi:hypothetical protein